MGVAPDRSIAEIVSRASELLEVEDEAREKMLELTREVIRLSRRAIFKAHEGNLDEAGKMLEMAAAAVSELLKFKVTHPRLYYGGAMASALAEYVEARVLHAYLSEGRIPSFNELTVEPDHYLLGLADFAGELRRLLVRYLSVGKRAEAERALALMEEIYRALATVAVPDALVRGLRHKVDVLRALIESSARDLLYYTVSSEVEQAMRAALSRLRGHGEGAV